MAKLYFHTRTNLRLDYYYMMHNGIMRKLVFERIAGSC